MREAPNGLVWLGPAMLAVGLIGVMVWPSWAQDAGPPPDTDTDVDTDVDTDPPPCAPGQLETDEGCVDLPRIVEIQGGPLRLGSPEGEPGRRDDEGPWDVVLDGTLTIATTEVRQDLFEAVVGGVPTEACGLPAAPDNPVACVSWHEAVRFCNALSRITGRTPVYTVEAGEVVWDRQADGWRLPTEAEWELAARAGTRSVLAGGDLAGAVAWSRADRVSHPQPVATRRRSDAGLYDLSGNVAEWVWDAYVEDRAAAAEGAVDVGPERVQKGGSWRDGEALLRIAARDLDRAEINDPAVGFRVVRGPALTLAPAEPPADAPTE